MKQKEISSFSYGVLAILGGVGILFSLVSPNGSSGAAAVGALFAILGIGGIVRNSRRHNSGSEKPHEAEKSTGHSEEPHS